MSEFIRVNPQGQVVPEDAAAQSRLAEISGRFYLPPASADLLLGVRAPCSGAKTAAPHVVLAGDLSGVPLADMVAFLNQIRASGILRVVTPSGERAIAFNKGEVRGAVSDNPADQLGEIAVRLGMVEREQLETVLASGPLAERIGRLLVEAGHLQAHDLWKCLKHQVSEVFHAILLAQEGVFMLVDQEVDERGSLAINTQGLLMDAIRRIDEMKEFRKRLPSSRAYVAQKKPAGPGLKPSERAIYDLCSGERTVGEIAQAARLTEFDATKILNRLIEAGYLDTVAVPKPVSMEKETPNASEIARVFDQVFREIFAEVGKARRESELMAAASGALAEQASRSPVLAKLSFADDGTLPRRALLQNLNRLGSGPAEAAQALHEALSGLMFFLLFEASELLERAADESLSRRVKQLLAGIEVET
jgi:hypothetical protein